MSRNLLDWSSAGLALLCLAVLAVTSTLAQFSSATTACTRNYVVEDGDTCDKIGQKTFTSTYQVMALNLPKAGLSCYTLEIGAELCLGTYGSDCQMVHRAASGDDCSTISSQYNITEDILQNNNPSLNCDQVYDGLMLCVVNGIVRPPSFTSLNLTYADEKNPTNATAATLPFGTAVVATNAAEAGPQTVQIVTVQASSTKEASSASATKEASSSSATQSSAVKRHNNLDNRGHGNHHHNHNAAAKRYQMSQTEDSL
ncbi:hypothetical protein CBS101457_000582 [Exobasidium rhododendri]|nr:hypothetical protein CBS101457_000582 [Exobasidium rhododendri]